MSILTLELDNNHSVKVHSEKRKKFIIRKAKDVVQDQTVKLQDVRDGERLYSIAHKQALETSTLLQLRLLPSMRKNICILSVIEKSRDFFKKSLRRKYKTPVMKLETPILTETRAAVVVERKQLENEHAICACCGGALQKDSIVLHVAITAFNHFEGGKGKQFKDSHKYFHYNSCMNTYQSWKVVTKQARIQHITSQELIAINPTAYSTGLEFQSGWVALDTSGKYFEYASDVPALLRVHASMKSRGICLSKICRVSRTTLNGEFAISIDQAKALVGLKTEDFVEIKERVDASDVPCNFVVCAESESTGALKLKYCNTMQDARDKFYSMRIEEDTMCYGFIKVGDIKDELSSCDASKV